MIGTSLGLLSAIVDNVPLVAATQGMYGLNTYPTDHFFWEFLALTTGTGGSAVIIVSAAGVAVMGIEHSILCGTLKKSAGLPWLDSPLVYLSFYYRCTWLVSASNLLPQEYLISRQKCCYD